MATTNSRPLRFSGLLLAMAVLAACSGGENLESSLRETIDGMEQALAASERRDFMQPIAEDFSGPGGMNRDRVRALLIFHLQRHQQLRSRSGPINVQVNDSLSPPRAEATWQTLVTGGSGWLPEQGQLYRVETGWRWEGEWQLISASWEAVL